VEPILLHLRRAYAPLAIIVYGSYADGTNNAHSDFDALVIVAEGEPHHDTSLVEGVRLDVFVQPVQSITGEIDGEAFIQLADSRIVLDTEGVAEKLVRRVQDYIASLPEKTAAEVEDDIAWCVKMLQRTRLGDAEGFYRWHWLLTESLEIYCGAAGLRYPGPKKAMRWLAAHEPEAYACYARALGEFSAQSLQEWIECLQNRPKVGK